MSNIEVLHTLYLVTMTAAVIMLVLTIVLFFVFDIRHVIGRMFGFSERKEVKRLKEHTDFTSQLNNRYSQKIKGQIYTDTGSLNKKQTPAERLGLTSETKSKKLKRKEEALPKQENDAALTTALNTGPALPEASGTDEIQTTVLGAPETDSQTVSGIAVPNLQFTIIRQIVMIHTEETIEI